MESFDFLSELLRNVHVVVIGDAMLDHYIWGGASRLSPEAPVPVVVVGNDEYRAGGAANVASNIVALGGKATLVCPVGADHAGSILLDVVKEKGVNVECSLKRTEVPTIVKTRVLALNQQVVRIDRERKVSLTRKEEEGILTSLDNISPLPTVLVLSDYAKGAITSTLARKLISWGQSRHIPVIVDPKPPHIHRFMGASLMTPNLSEAGRLVGRDLLHQEDVEQGAQELRQALSLEGILITQGSDGMTYAGVDKTFHLPALSMEVYDVSGAGDTVAAALSLTIGGQFPIEEACLFANMAAGMAVQKRGTSIVSLQEVLTGCYSEDMAAMASRLKTVLTNQREKQVLEM
ncbi:MAG: PfkB family carbohydrate kinase [Aminobacterium sp.]|jgi:rfaE bifunctional protein kinase chain/domain|uniref:bifunctional heptose 7-phosphate kinase/heptose 1-phosphate adenyltransferase n=1 Tax=unclassified Aminobacterium TaxID=2685012 RepID=UPI001BCF73BB|nr:MULTISPECIES: PfkB family carbohydrate kinase [unclassified Aminobacterium]MDD2206457.1 PfkB family carbohydrate kinase [Aminobacterium sp.]MDD3425353.1 PfkB family carbohydrate kinase [Aminobacterium sp.]MDD3706948.1 PfkB family carbohydrate kinase [Aminobacterium sp.]MDD4228208.1 PfkB family carbohydrate kinase [Aminobacterium sp.]MDD4551245.1 PfkB family carbohydrate kinase [Aminobacterium sp.]